MHTYHEHEDLATMDDEAVESFFSEIRSLAASQRRITVALSGGRSLRGFYQRIAARARELSPFIWRRLRFCFADERLLDPYDEYANYYTVYQDFFSFLLDEGFIRSQQILMVPVHHEQPAVRYTKMVGSVDVFLLGVGEDGHVASLFPGHPFLWEEGDGYGYIDNAPKAPSERVSVTSSQLLGGKVVLAFFVGDGKQQAYEDFQDPMVLMDDCPVKLIKFLPSMHVFCCPQDER